MTEKRFELKWRDTGEVLYDNETGLEHRIYSPNYRFHVRDMMNEFDKENKKLKLQNEELLYQIGEVGKNNKTCRECECFIPKIKYCYMWDMEVEADDVVVACDQRNVKNIKEMMSND